MSEKEQKEQVVLKIELEPMVDSVKKGGTTGTAISCNVKATCNLKEEDRTMSDTSILLTSIHALLSSFMEKKGIKLTKDRQDAITDVLNSVYTNVLGNEGSCVAKSGSFRDADTEEIVSEIKKGIEEIRADKKESGKSDYLDEDEKVANDMTQVSLEIKSFDKITSGKERNKIAESLLEKIKGCEPEFMGAFIMALAFLKNENPKAYDRVKCVIDYYLGK